jgi:GT2 family glycosyltransferase
VARGARGLPPRQGAHRGLTVGAGEPREPKPLVGAVVINWHDRERSLRCAAALRRLSFPNLRLVLVDNGSAQFSAAEVERLSPGGRYFPAPINLGFAGGANLGMRAALAFGADYIWFLNNDTEPEPEALAEMIAVAESAPPAAVVGAKILRRDDPRRIDSVALRVDLRWGRLYLTGHDEVDRGQYDHLREVTAVTACSMLVGRAACDKLGGFDESFFAYLEDADFCLRARALGLGVAAAPRARVLHDRASAIEGRQSVTSLYYNTRNHLALLGRHDRGGFLARRLRLGIACVLNLAYAARRGSGPRRERLAAVWRGMLDYRRGVTGAGWQ